VVASRIQGDCGGEGYGSCFDAEDARAERNGLPASGERGGDFFFGEAAFGADGELREHWRREIDFGERPAAWMR
jgi:hypothetical protein